MRLGRQLLVQILAIELIQHSLDGSVFIGFVRLQSVSPFTCRYHSDFSLHEMLSLDSQFCLAISSHRVVYTVKISNLQITEHAGKQSLIRQ